MFLLNFLHVDLLQANELVSFNAKNFVDFAIASLP